MDKLVQSLGITTLSRSQVSVMAKDLGAHVEEFRTRRLEEAGPFTFVAADALVLKVREGGRAVGVHVLVGPCSPRCWCGGADASLRRYRDALRGVVRSPTRGERRRFVSCPATSL